MKIEITEVEIQTEPDLSQQYEIAASKLDKSTQCNFEDFTKTVYVPQIEYKDRIVYVTKRALCSICYDEIPDESNFIIHRCGHNFCGACIREWFASQRYKQNIESFLRVGHPSRILNTYSCPKCKIEYRSSDLNNLLRRVFPDYEDKRFDLCIEICSKRKK